MSDLDEELKRVRLQREKLALQEDERRAARRQQGVDLAHTVAATTRAVGARSAPAIARAIVGLAKILGGAAALGVVGVVVSHVYSNMNPPKIPVEHVQASRAGASKMSEQIAAAVGNGAEYNAAVADLEHRYPVLNPESPAYQEQVARQVLERATQRVAAGEPKHLAIRRAVDDVLGVLAR